MHSAIKQLVTGVAVLVCLASVLGAASCGATEPNGLMSGASPNTSALMLWYYDGEAVYSSFLFDSREIQKVIDELDEV